MLSDKEQLSFIKGSEKIKSIDDEIDGLKITAPDTLTILFKEPIESPFAWLTSWELGIIKSEFVNNDGSLKSPPPNSGKWAIAHEKENLVTFKSGDKTLSIVEVESDDLAHYAQHIDSNHLIIALTGYLSEQTLDVLSKSLSRFDQVGNRMNYLEFDPKSSAFENKRARQFIASEVRNYIASSNRKPEGSVVPVSEREYLPLKNLENLIPVFSAIEKESITKELKSRPITIRNIKSLCFGRVRNVLEKKGITVSFSDNPDIDCYSSGIPRGEALGALNNFLGYGKVPTLQPYVDDKNLQEILHSDLSRSKKINRLNKYLFEESVIAVVNHSNIAHYTNKRTKVKKHLEKVISIEEFFFD